MDINRYYRHSGTVTFHGLLFMLLLGTVTSICLPVIYGYCLQVIPYIWIRLFLTCVVALAVGALIGLSARLGKVRNPLLASALGLLFGLLAEYVGWVAWLYAFSGQQALIFSPDEIYTIMKEIAGTGLWSFHGFAPKGATLFMVWGIEALIIIIPAAAIPFTMIGIPYCETCSKWMDNERTLYARECPENIETLKTLLEAGRYKPLTELKILHETKGKDYLIIQTNFCDGCRALYVLDISVVRSKLPGSGPDNRGERTVVSKLLIDARVYRALQGSPVSGVSDEKTG